jgi:3-isopropylmalate/(R)-2-methylmalate dehydratase small subunit
MSGWSHHKGCAIALPLENVDTDQLIPARFMSVPRGDGYGPFLLHDLRFDRAGNARAEFPLNRHPEATVLVARRNFGGGSSREAAVYALADFGIRAVIAPGFGDIFAANAINNGLLPARLDEDSVARLLHRLGDGAGAVNIDLEQGRIDLAGQSETFVLDQAARRKLINGWDDIDLTASQSGAIAAFRAARLAQYPWAWPAARGQ